MNVLVGGGGLSGSPPTSSFACRSGTSRTIDPQ